MTRTSQMRAEIYAQREALGATLDALLAREDEIADAVRSQRHVLFIGRGSSDNAAVYGRYLIEVFTGRLTSSGSPSVATLYGASIDLHEVLVVAVSQSGQTQEIVDCIVKAAKCGARTVAITTDGASPLAQAADLSLVTPVGEELAVPATKTYTSQLVALAVLCRGLGGDLDLDALRRAPGEVERMIAVAMPAVERAAVALDGYDRAVVCGRGFAVTTAYELALKLQETCQLQAVGLATSDLQHGPMAIVGHATPAIIVGATAGPTLPALAAVATQARSAGAQVITIGGGRDVASAATVSIPGPDLPEWLAPLGLIVPGQLLAETLARRRALDPDAPHGLQKVTQTS